MLTFRIEVAVGAAYKSGTLGMMGALKGVVKAPILAILSEGVICSSLDVSIFLNNSTLSLWFEIHY